MQKWIAGNVWTRVSRFSWLTGIALLGLAFYCSVAVVAAPAQRHSLRRQTKFHTYFNERFGYVILYPAGVLFPQGEADNHDGQKFMSIHADAILTVYGRYNILNKSLESLYQEAARGGLGDDPKRVITYRVLKQDGFVVSGYDYGQVFYEKTIVNKDEIQCMDFVYPERLKSYYAPLAVKIAGSFHRLR
jgi:hypothetical protein